MRETALFGPSGTVKSVIQSVSYPLFITPERKTNAETKRNETALAACVGSSAEAPARGTDEDCRG